MFVCRCECQFAYVELFVSVCEFVYVYAWERNLLSAHNSWKDWVRGTRVCEPQKLTDQDQRQEGDEEKEKKEEYEREWNEDTEEEEQKQDLEKTQNRDKVEKN